MNSWQDRENGRNSRMRYIGIDIGTSKICALLCDGNGKRIRVLAEKNAYLDSPRGYEKIQDPDRIVRICRELLSELADRNEEIGGIGITGQMHGILYLDENGKAVSPLYTWEDRRGDEPKDGSGLSWAGYVAEKTGERAAAGYGTVTHFYNQGNGLVPENAVTFCTVPDYLALSLTGSRIPMLDRTMAASIGLFDPEKNGFDRGKLEKLGLDPEFYPQIARNPHIGNTAEGIPVYAAIGDNQASYFGSTVRHPGALLINMGTGAQISIRSDRKTEGNGIEARPYIEDHWWLSVGAALSGGESYAILMRFFKEIMEMAGAAVTDGQVYGIMDRLLQDPDPETLPVFIPLFNGTREDPDRKASITGISSRNFTPKHILVSLLDGMAEQIFQMYREYLDAGGKEPSCIIGSGNGIRKNPHLHRALEKKFGYPVLLSDQKEEAAFGAAMYAAGQNTPVK